jgi:hypothetical protein
MKHEQQKEHPYLASGDGLAAPESRAVAEIKDRAALESACKFIEQHVAPRKCDSDGVSACWRCNSVYLAKRMRELLTAPAPDAAVIKESHAQLLSVARKVAAVRGVELDYDLDALDKAIEAARTAITNAEKPS